MLIERVGVTVNRNLNPAALAGSFGAEAGFLVVVQWRPLQEPTVTTRGQAN